MAKDKGTLPASEANAGDAKIIKQVGSAPELPHDVAKEYGLHHEHDVKPSHESEASPGKEAAAEVPPSLEVDNPKTDQAVDDIVAKESDELLNMQGEKPPAQPAKRTFRQKIANFFKAWWRNKWARYITIVVLLAAIIAVAIIPGARYFVLNTVGVRSSASIIVLDETTQLPLKNVSVTLGSKKAQTDIKGVAKLQGLKLGKYQLAVKRIAFAEQTRQVTIGWGSNPLGSVKLHAVGTQYTIQVTDYLSGKPLEGAEAESEQGNALSDKNGKIILTVEDTDVTKLAVTLRANGYRNEPVALDAANTASVQQALVPAEKAVFVSKQSGKYDVISSDLDGKNHKLLLAGTGLESSSISLVVSPDNKQAALISQRENMRDADGYLLYSLTIINITEGTSSVVERAQQIVPVDWLGNRLIYRTTIAGASAANAQRNRLISYNYESNARMQLATANQFNVALSAKGIVYFAASSTDPRATMGLFRIKPDGSARERLSDKEVWTTLRTSYNTLSLQSPDGWYTHTIGSKEFTKASGPPNFVTYSYVEQANGSSLWADTRDGKGVLSLLAKEGQNTVLVAQPGLTYPVRWAGDKAVVYRVATSSETADYAASPNGGTPRKISDVTPSFGFAQIY